VCVCVFCCRSGGRGGCLPRCCDDNAFLVYSTITIVKEKLRHPISGKSVACYVKRLWRAARGGSTLLRRVCPIFVCEDVIEWRVKRADAKIISVSTR